MDAGNLPRLTNAFTLEKVWRFAQFHFQLDLSSYLICCVQPRNVPEELQRRFFQDFWENYGFRIKQTSPDIIVTLHSLHINNLFFTEPPFNRFFTDNLSCNSGLLRGKYQETEWTNKFYNEAFCGVFTDCIFAIFSCLGSVVLIGLVSFWPMIVMEFPKMTNHNHTLNLISLIPFYVMSWWHNHQN